MVVAVLRDSDIDTAVASDGQEVIEAHREIVVLAAGPQPRAFLAGADEQTVFDLPASLGRLPRTFPAGEVLAIEH